MSLCLVSSSLPRCFDQGCSSGEFCYPILDQTPKILHILESLISTNYLVRSTVWSLCWYSPVRSESYTCVFHLNSSLRIWKKVQLDLGVWSLHPVNANISVEHANLKIEIVSSFFFIYSKGQLINYSSISWLPKCICYYYSFKIFLHFYLA